MIKIKRTYKLFLIIVLLLCLSLIYFLIKSPVTENVKNYNVVLIIIDSLRADHLSCYGYETNTTPNICALAKDGVLFENAFSQGTFTLSSISSMMTSKYSMQLNINDFNQTFTSETTTLFDILKKKSYFTELISEHPYMCVLFWQKYLDKKIDLYNCTNLNFSSQHINLFNVPTPFFSYIHLISTHQHFEPLNNDECKEFSINRVSFNQRLSYMLSHKKFDLNFSKEELKCIVHRYDEEIKYADEQIQEIIEKLKEKGMYENTLIIITADHGEAFDEHGNIFHGGIPYNEVIHVPLIIKFPAKYYNTTVEQTVRLIDLVPTILNFLDIKNDKKLEGVSLIPAIEGKNLNLTILGQYGLKIDDWKYITLEEYEGLYNLKKDPGEFNNLVNNQSELVSEFRNTIYQLKVRLHKEAISPATIRIDEKLKSELRQLGYVVD